MVSLRCLAQIPAKLASRSPENKDADSPADYYSDFPAAHSYRGHRAEIRYRANMPVRRRLEWGAEKVRGRRDASARHRSNGMDTIYFQRKKAVLRGSQHRQHPQLCRIADVPRNGEGCENGAGWK